jgi:hypothetical protein
MIWMIGSIDRTNQGPDSVFRYDTTRVLAIDGPTAYLAHIHDNNYELERHELPPITC